MHITRTLYGRAVAGLLFAVVNSSGFGGQIDGEALLTLLVKKGLITESEAAALRTEATVPARAGVAPSSVIPSSLSPADAPTRGERVTPVEVEKPSPLSFRIGSADFTPVGFMDFTAFYRTTNVGSGIGTNFAAIPLRNTPAGRLSETKFSAQNSRLGLRVDSAVSDTKVLGYVESDFLGNAPANLGVSSNAATLRMRLYFADIKWRNWEFLAGQDWTMLTPNRKGIGVMPGDLFFSMNVDTNYQLGLTWARQPQIRAIYHAGSGITAAVSLENPDQYAGGSNGAGAVTLPAGFNAAQVDTGVATSAPNLHPDVIGKVAWDTQVGDLAWHFDATGLLRSFKVNNFSAGSNAFDADTTTLGGGIALSSNVEVAKGLSLLANGFWSKGGGRYLFGQAPDLVVLPADVSGAYKLRALTADSYLVGAEWQASARDTFYAYYGRVRIGRRYAAQGAGFVGYGYPGAPTSHNRTIEELTFGNTHTLWKSPNYGALQFMTQYSFVEREPWFVAPGTPTKAEAGMLFFNVRYVLP